MNNYAMHYNTKAGNFSVYDSRAAHTAYLRPICQIRGMKEVTANKDEVTCQTCRAKLAR